MALPDDDCFSKRIDGVDAYLTVEGSVDGPLQTVIMAARDGSGPFC